MVENILAKETTTVKAKTGLVKYTRISRIYKD